jgi:hypothetical protein
MKPVARTLPEPRLQSTKKNVARQSVVALSPTQELELKATQEKAREKARKTGNFIKIYWPIFVAVFISGFAPEWFNTATATGTWAQWFTFPYTMLARYREIGLDAHFTTILPHAAVYMQSPIDGAYVSFTLARGKSLTAGIVQVLVIHGVCTAVLALLTYL